MFSVEPFKLIRYSPSTVTSGEVKYSYDGHYMFDKLTGEVEDAVIKIGDSLKRAYDVKTVIERPKVNVFSTKISPVVAKLDKRALDFDLRYSNLASIKHLRGLIRIMKNENKHSVMIRRDDNKGFYLTHMLEEQFNPETTGEFMLFTECFLLGLGGQEFGKTGKEIRSDIMKIEVEVKMPEQVKPPNRIMYG